MNASVKSFFVGFRSLFVGLSLIRQESKLLKIAIIPFIINFVVLISVFFYSKGKLSSWVDQALSVFFSNKDSFFWNIFYWPSFVFAWLVLLAILFFLAYVVANILASPFNSFLSEETLLLKEALLERKFQLKSWVTLFVKMFWASLLKTILFLLIAIFIFILSFIPIVSILASFALLLIMAFDSSDYSFEVLGYSLSQRITFFKRHFFYFSGLGLALGLTLWIPGLNFLLFPAAVVGSANLIGDTYKNKLIE